MRRNGAYRFAALGLSLSMLFGGMAYAEAPEQASAAEEGQEMPGEPEAEEGLAISNERGEYAALTDEQFANFRNVATTGMGEAVLYRSSSPIDPALARNAQADAAAALYGVKTVLNLADAAQEMPTLGGYAGSYYAGLQVMPLALDEDVTTPAFAAGLAGGLRYLAQNESPYLIHGTAGIERTGFAGAVLEALMGANADEIADDYMESFANYYGITRADERYAPIADGFAGELAAALGIESIYAADLSAAAEGYLQRAGLSAEEIASLKKKLSGEEEEETTEAETEEETTEPIPETEPETEPTPDTEPVEVSTGEPETESVPDAEPVEVSTGTAETETETPASTSSASQAEAETTEEETPASTSQTSTAETTEEETTGSAAETTETPEAPFDEFTPGNTMNGFTVTQVRDFPLIGAKAVAFTHEKTGAGLLYLANEDTNRVFDLTFFTRATDNTGLPHVFEHATLDGSAKYPSKSLFFNLSYQTYNTYMNAMTYQNMTTYPVASLSEAQLLKYADYYTDSCFNPTILEDESIFREEAWRYRLAYEDDDLTIEGTVYSEMLGAYDLDRAAAYNQVRTALPGALAGNVSGGAPDSIPEMTYESLKAYHELYYHPSNCTAFLYGDFEDYKAFLALLDAEFSKYEKKEFAFEETSYTPITGSVSEEFPFGVEEGSDTDRGAVIYYAYVLPGLKEDPQQELIINTLTDILAVDSSPLMSTLRDALPGGEFAAYIETEGPDDLLMFLAEHVNPEDTEIFRLTVDEAMQRIAEEGFDADLVESVAANLSLSVRLTPESDSVGVNIIPSIAYTYSNGGGLFGYLDYVDELSRLEENNEKGLYQKAVQDWVFGNELTALTVTYPVAGLKDEEDAALAGHLAEVKEGLTEEELIDIIARTNAPEDEDDASVYVAQLQAVTVDSLPEEVKIYEIQDETDEEGIRHVSAVAGVDGIGQTALFLDAAGLPLADIHWFHLYTDLIGELDTFDHTVDELTNLSTRYLYDGEIRLSLMDEEDGYHPWLRIGWIALDEDLEQGYALVDEILYNTDFSDSEKLTALVQKKKSALKSSITGNIYSIQLYRALAASSELYRYYDYYNYLEYYQFMEEVEGMLSDSPADVTDKLQEMAWRFHNRAGAIAGFAGNEESIEKNTALADAFLAKLDDEAVEPQIYEFPAQETNEAIIIDSSVQFNALVADYESLGLDGYDAGLDAVAALVSDTYLYPMLRDQYGAYGVFHGAVEDGGVYIISYRDPNVRETFEVYDTLPVMVSVLEPDQESLDGYILSSYSQYALSSGELAGAADALVTVLNGGAQEDVLEAMRQLKSVTPETVADYAGLYEKLAENGVRSTAGSAAAINANADLYNVIINPFGAKDAAEVEFTDVTEESGYYEVVRFVFEEGLMAPLEEESFGVEEEATLGDLAGALYVLIGGERDAQEEAVAFLAEYEIVPENAEASDPLTDARCRETLYYFTWAVGLEADEPGEAEERVLNRGELAERLAEYVNSLE